ncbi:hypothetical protein COL26b_004444 [Colletotrichum chrysophilum]|uniref:uncharacterized protein n=1 Tax=Colletotrichum chrysophilum TaxID=1836956 RepID=UPI002300A190|nr:uncharacterized protein COL26b_004444 [Colletotrichum chrysophilum]KAJ0377255.1 hypothetical protein COL26b_004444 [Colletotrichum chrysophilum]
MSSTKNDELMAFSPALMAKWEAAADKASRDFRSDVVTVPTPDMMQAILEATVNDDIYDVDGDPSVKALEARLAELTGKEAALWAISGTQGNQICLRTHLTQPPHTVLLDYRAHVHCWESGALPVMSQASATTVHPKNGVHLTLDDVKANMIADGNNAQAISKYVRSFPVPEGQKPVAMHLDAARLFDGVIGEGVDLKAYAACFDSLSICLAKGIGAPMGSVILGSKQFIERAKWFRKMFGGGTRQPGMMAAAALEALNYTLPRMGNVHALTKKTAAQIEKLGYKLALPVQTNMIVLDLAAVDIPAASFVDYCARRRVSVFPNGRIVFHHQVTDNGANALLAALTELVGDKNAGVVLSDVEVHGGYS